MKDSELYQLYNSGMNDYEVARIIHVGRNKLKIWREQHGISSKTRKKGLLPSLSEDILFERFRGKSFKLIAKKYGVTRTSITKLLNRNGFKYDIPGRKTPDNIKDYSLSQKQKEILIGDMFGDGHLCRPSKRSAYYTCSHCLEQEEFVFMKALSFLPLSSRIYYGYNSDGSAYVSLSTWSSPCLVDYHNSFYPQGSGNKTLPSIKLTDQSLSYWFMGDGSLNREKARFSVGVDVNLEPALVTLNLYYPGLFKIKKYKKEQIVFVTDQEKFFPAICPFIPPVFLYKIPEKYQYLCKGNFSELMELKKDRNDKIPYKILL